MRFLQGKKQNGRSGDGASTADVLDESVRCRMSGICEGSLACKPGSDEVLGCITNSTERQGKVKEAMLWSWKGYRYVLLAVSIAMNVRCALIQRPS